MAFRPFIPISTSNRAARLGQGVPFPAKLAKKHRVHQNCDVKPTYSVLNPFDCDVKPKYRIWEHEYCDVRPRYSLRYFYHDVRPTYEVVTHEYCDIKPKYFVYPAIGSDVRFPLHSPFEVSSNWNIDPDFSISISVLREGQAAKSLGDRPYKFVIDHSESAPSTWSLDFIDPFGQVNPMKVGGEFEGLLDERPYTSVSGQPKLTKFLKVEALVGGTDFHFTGVGTNWSHTRDFQNRYFSFSFKGTDCSIKLNKDAQTMKDIRSSARDGVTKSDKVLKEILTQYGCEYNLEYYLPDAHTIPVMHRQNGNPQDWVAAIIGALLFESRWENGVKFTPYLPMPDSPVPVFTHDFSKMSVFSEQYEGSLLAIINKVVAIRAAEGGGAATPDGAEKPGVDVFEFGDGYSVSFNPALDSPSHETVQANNGFFSNIKYFRGNQLLGVRDVTSGSANYGVQFTSSGLLIGADRATFTWGVAPGGFIGTGSPGRIQFTGVPHVEDDVWGGSQFGEDGTADDPAPSFRAEAINQASINKYGLRPTEVSASALIPTKEVLQKFADRYLKRVGRQARKASYKIPLNPHIVPGTLIREIDSELGTDKIRVVNSCQHSFSTDPKERFTTYTGTDYSQLTR